MSEVDKTKIKSLIRQIRDYAKWDQESASFIIDWYHVNEGLNRITDVIDERCSHEVVTFVRYGHDSVCYKCSSCGYEFQVAD